jgi:hypothetical protein
VPHWQISLKVSIGDSFKRTRKHLLIHTVAILFGLLYHYQLIKRIFSFRIIDETAPLMLCRTLLQEKAKVVAFLTIHYFREFLTFCHFLPTDGFEMLAKRA